MIGCRPAPVKTSLNYPQDRYGWDLPSGDRSPKTTQELQGEQDIDGLIRQHGIVDGTKTLVTMPYKKNMCARDSVLVLLMALRPVVNFIQHEAANGQNIFIHKLWDLFRAFWSDDVDQDYHRGLLDQRLAPLWLYAAIDLRGQQQDAADTLHALYQVILDHCGDGSKTVFQKMFKLEFRMRDIMECGCRTRKEVRAADHCRDSDTWALSINTIDSSDSFKRKVENYFHQDFGSKECGRCHRKAPVHRFKKLIRLPEVLLVEIGYQAGQDHHPSVRIDVPETLDLGFLEDKPGHPLIPDLTSEYSLVAVVSYNGRRVGDTTEGHYLTYLRRDHRIWTEVDGYHHKHTNQADIETVLRGKQYQPRVLAYARRRTRKQKADPGDFQEWTIETLKKRFLDAGLAQNFAPRTLPMFRSKWKAHIQNPKEYELYTHKQLLKLVAARKLHVTARTSRKRDLMNALQQADKKEDTRPPIVSATANGEQLRNLQKNIDQQQNEIEVLQRNMVTMKATTKEDVIQLERWKQTAESHAATIAKLGSQVSARDQVPQAWRVTVSVSCANGSDFELVYFIPMYRDEVAGAQDWGVLPSPRTVLNGVEHGVQRVQVAVELPRRASEVARASHLIAFDAPAQLTINVIKTLLEAGPMPVQLYEDPVNDNPQLVQSPPSHRGDDRKQDKDRNDSSDASGSDPLFRGTPPPLSESFKRWAPSWDIDRGDETDEGEQKTPSKRARSSDNYIDLTKDDIDT